MPISNVIMVITSVMLAVLYQKVDFSAINPALKYLSSSHQKALLQEPEDIQILNNTQIVGEVCVYSEKNRWMRFKRHVIIVHLIDGTYALFKWDPSGIGIHPSEHDPHQRFTAYHDWHPLFKFEKSR